MSNTHNRYFRRLSRKAKVSAKSVGRIWVEETSSMIEEGFNQNNPKFIQILNDRVKMRLNLENDDVFLDKFKKFL